MQKILITVVLIGLVWSSHTALRALIEADTALAKESAAQLEVLYLPQGRALEFISFGYRNLFSDILWFNTISYFGKHYVTDRNYGWLKHMCSLVTRLDPRKRHVYEFCGLMLAWESSDYDGSIEQFNRAIEQFPDQWKLYFQRGFTEMFFKNDADKARQDFMKAASLPGAEPIAARLAAKKLLTTSEPEEAIVFLNELLRQTNDKVQRKALTKRLREARYELDLRALEKAMGEFEARQGRALQELSELKQAGMVREIPTDPWGGSYFLDQSDRQIKSSSNRKRLGLYKHKTIADHLTATP